MPFDYYAGRPVEPHVEQYETPAVPAGCSRVWLVASHQGLPTGTAASRAHYARYVALRAALARRYPRPRDAVVRLRERDLGRAVLRSQREVPTIVERAERRAWRSVVPRT